MKKCFSTLGCTDYPLERVIALCRENGIEGVEIRGLSSVMDNEKIPEFQPDNIGRTAELLGEAGIVPAVIGTSCKFHDRAYHTDNIEEGIASAKIAAALGCGYIRVFGNSAKPDLPTAARAVTDGIGALCGVVEKYGVTVLLEVHGDFNTIENLLPVTERLKSVGNFGLIWDVFHTEKTGICGWEDFWEVFSPLVRHVHVKDGRELGKAGRNPLLCLPGEGEMPLVPIIRMLDSEGFDGFVSLEWERKWHPELPPIEDALKAYGRVCGLSR